MYERGMAMKDREATVAVVKALCGEANGTDDVSMSHSDLSSVHGEGPLILSNIPDSCRDGVILGIDEAGRGSVIGPMVYGMCFWSADATSIPSDFNDSKQLNEMQRNRLFETILESPDIGFCSRILPASEISRNMLRNVPHNLNQMSHDAAMSMIRALQQARVTIHTCYIDTVGNAASYQRRLEQEFPGVEFVVESKADDKYPPCSAASIGKNYGERYLEYSFMSCLTLPAYFYYFNTNILSGQSDSGSHYIQLALYGNECERNPFQEFWFRLSLGPHLQSVDRGALANEKRSDFCLSRCGTIQLGTHQEAPGHRDGRLQQHGSGVFCGR
jgi:ribonuclease H